MADHELLFVEIVEMGVERFWRELFCSAYGRGRRVALFAVPHPFVKTISCRLKFFVNIPLELENLRIAAAPSKLHEHVSKHCRSPRSSPHEKDVVN